ncbi:MAG: shikimate dehydrogenase [Armatimonadetes bacterium]|nr:shikimate dehydrogenase [Armatimonadota bacterium]MDW8120845.1 shikimate dehydrogenase [Armatimonadota bacterium]
MNRFAFLIHPLDIRRDVARRYPWAARLPEWVLEALLRILKPQVLGKIEGVRSPFAETEGWLIGVPMTPKGLLTDEKRSLPLLLRACQMAQQMGAQIVGLGAFTAIAGGKGKWLADHSPIPVTTGNSYTVATALEATVTAAKWMGHNLSDSTVAIVGATGSIGRSCGVLIGEGSWSVNSDSGKAVPRQLILIGRNPDLLQKIKAEIGDDGCPEVVTTTNLREGLKQADIILACSSSVAPIIEPADLKPGAVVCDVARPRDVSEKVRDLRDDVLVIDGGIVEVPGSPRWQFSIGLPSHLTLACVAETMLLALEGKVKESYTVGPEIRSDYVREMAALAHRHGFRVSGLRSFEQVLDSEKVEAIRRKAQALRTAR